MTATDELLKKLRMLKYDYDSMSTSCEDAIDEIADELEQAIAATLGSNRETALEELVRDWQELYENPDYGECVRLTDRTRKLGIEVEQ